MKVIDCFYGLEYFAKNDRSYDERMAEAVELVKENLNLAQ
jgi:hypothetical protein